MVNGYCCSSCNRRLPRDSFSNNQWRKGEGRSRCHACVNSGARGNNNDTGNNVDIDSLTRSTTELLQRMQLEQIAKPNTVDATQTALQRIIQQMQLKQIAKPNTVDATQTALQRIIQQMQLKQIAKPNTVDATQTALTNRMKLEQIAKLNSVDATQTARTNRMKLEQIAKLNTVDATQTALTNRMKLEQIIAKLNTVDATQTARTNRMKLEQIAKLNTVDATQTARTNNATRATFKEIDLQNPFAQGSFRWVAKGVYTHGSRAGEPCVCKWFKTGGVVESSFYDIDLSTVEKALDLITKWNSSGMVNKMVQINQPAVWTFDRNSSARAGKKVLQEPFIANYQKFNSNTGWADDSTPWPRVMQALSHFSYHVSGGIEMICDLQGGYYNDGVILTDPVILSLARKYGPTDLGSKGINNFFGHHTCNEFCRSEWRKPILARISSAARKGTTMEEVPTVTSRPQMSIMRGIHE